MILMTVIQDKVDFDKYFHFGHLMTLADKSLFNYSLYSNPTNVLSIMRIIIDKITCSLFHSTVQSMTINYIVLDLNFIKERTQEKKKRKERYCTIESSSSDHSQMVTSFSIRSTIHLYFLSTIKT